jgi:hypothetical protein
MNIIKPRYIDSKNFFGGSIMKKILTKLFCITLVLSGQSLFAQYSGGNGLTSGTAYQIANATDLAALATAVNGGTSYSGFFFTQTADIALSGSWTPIGVDVVGARFSGIYDGNGHKITGLVISNSANYQGLFGYVIGGTISNLGVEGVSVAGGTRVGALIGSAAFDSHIINCYSTGTVSGSGAAGFVGGLIGMSWDNAVVTNCYSRAAVTGLIHVGGLIGYLFKDVNSSNIINCYSSGAVAVPGGGFVGTVDGASTITACFWDNQTSGQAHGGDGTDVTGVTGESTVNMKTQSTYTAAPSWDITGTVWRIDLSSTINGGYPFLAWQNPSGGTTLPVELTSFTSTVNKNGVTLTWSTATEINNYGFNVERRAVNSTSSWAKIGFVAGHGTSNATIAYSYTDAGLASGSYAYRLKQIDNGGAFKYSQSIEVVAVSLAPTVIGLSQNYPNPFNPTTQISFSVATTEQAKLVVYNLLGQPVVTLFDGVANGQQAYKLSFDASKYSTGVYFYKLETPSRTEVRRMQVLK